jgi:hypothetical protein
MTGLFELIHDNSTPDAQDAKDTALVKDVDTVDVWMTEDGLIKLAHDASVFTYADGVNLHASKAYTCVATKPNRDGVMVSWSYNGFAEFVIRLLSALEGKSLQGGEQQPATFGYVFDKLEIRPD